MTIGDQKTVARLGGQYPLCFVHNEEGKQSQQQTLPLAFSRNGNPGAAFGVIDL